VIVIHPTTVARAGIGDLVRHWQLRGYTIGNPAGSRYLHVTEPPPVRPPPSEETDTVRLYRPRIHFWPTA
jgi:hypothetical protein